MATTRVTIVPPLYKRILSRFPQNFTFCFAYGSAVKKQLQNKSENLIDLIFCVNNPSAWHEANLKHNSSHYSGLKYFGHNLITHYQQNFGAKVYFNTLVPLDDIWIKYGVVATEDLVTDLLEWSHLYLAGRLHKPVEIIKKPLSSDLDTALQLNLQSAVHAALLILPESFTEYEFYHTISNLSYSGDFRMTFGENKNKVENIVKAQLPGFRQLYRPFILSLPDYVDFPMLKEGSPKQTVQDKNTAITNSPVANEDIINCAQDVSPIAKLHHLNQLPRWPQKALTRFWNKGTLRQDTEDVLRAIAYDPDCGLIVKQCINDIVWKSSASQSLKSIVTAGLFKSVKYSKLKKMYHFSDSDSVDSDEGIRYKTESIRNKKSSDKSSERNKESRSHRERNRSRSRSRSRSRHHIERKKSKKQKRDYSPEDKSNRKSSRSRHRESDRSDDRKHRKEKIKSKKDDTNTYKKETISPQIGEKFSDEHLKVVTSEKCGPKLPKLETTNNDKEEPALKLAEDNSKNLSFGPILPPVADTPTKLESTDEKQPEKDDTFGPQLPPHLLKKPNEDNLIGPVLPSHFVTVSSLDDDSSDDADPSNCQDDKETSTQSNVIGPSLPPHLLKKNENEEVVGPTLPPHLQQSDTTLEEEEEEVYGPIPAGAHYSQAHIELEERALQMKMDQLDSSGDKQPVREEWMLTLPEAKAATFGLGPRQFRRKAGPDLSDRSSWTDTPEDKAKKKQGKAEPVVDLKKEAELKHIHNRNVEQEKIAKDHKKEKDSLLEIHRKKLKKEKTNESGPSERRPFSREIDLQVNRFDDAQKQAVLKKAQLLDNRFSAGESKFL